MYLIRETILRYKINILFITFNHAKESVSSKNVAWLLSKTVSKNINKHNEMKGITINVHEKW